MDETTTNERQRELDEIKRRYPEMYYVTAAVMLIGVGVAVGYVLFADREGFSANLFTETISVAVTVLILNRLAERRDEKRETKRLKENLIAQMGSQIKEVAVPAVEELRRREWLTDGSLKGAYLFGANLEGAKLWNAHLEGAILPNAHLEGAILERAHLEGAILTNAHLEGAKLSEAHLEGAKLWFAHLEGANLWFAHLEGAKLFLAHLEGANLMGAHLEGANLDSTQFNEETMLPDGTQWTPETDMHRFTDSTHLDFWQPPDYE